MTIANELKQSVQRITVTLCTAIQASCYSDHSPLPNLRPVYLEVSLYSHKELLTPGAIITLMQARTYADRLGYAGILIVRSLTEEEFYAYDLACSYEQTPTRLEVKGEQAVCPVCQSKFDILLSYGAPIQGPATHPLRVYRTHYTPSTKLLRITN